MLLALIGYFLKNEYDEELNRMELEFREQHFIQIFADATDKPLNLPKGVAINSFGLKMEENDEAVFDFKIDYDNNEQMIMIGGSDSAETFSITEIQSNHLDSNKHFEGGDKVKVLKSFNHYVEEDSISYIDTMFSFDYDSSEMDTTVAFNFKNIIKTLSDKKPFTKKDVLANMWPQILFSSLLLLITGLAYYFFLSKINKDRRLNKLRNEFMSNMTHELKTPVSTISVALEALKNFDAADNKVMRKEYLDITTKEIDRLGLLVDKALNISLFEQDKMVLNKQKLNFADELDSVLSILKVQFENNHVALHYDKALDGDFDLVGDKTHLVNVIHNLLENAIKYASDNPTINISLKDLGQSVVLVIKDNGIGIPNEYIDKVFDKFFRVPLGNQHNSKGHGLGLSYVKQVIDNHEGAIQLESVEGQGATFTIQIPKQV